MTNKQKIIAYYDECEPDYKVIWDLDKSLAMHYGYWDGKVKNLRDALRRENEILAQKAHIKESDLVLDAGCGVGGSSIYLAENIGCNVIGISLSKKQVETATKNSLARNLKDKVTFKQMDFTKMEFRNNQIDVVLAVESICCSSRRKDFVEESYRVLKKGGRLIVADFFAGKKCDAPGKELMKRLSNGWATNKLDSAVQFKMYLKNAGFKNILYSNVTTYILPSSKMLYRYSLPGILLWKSGQFMGLTTKLRVENAKACYYQYKSLQRNLWEYGIFYAEK